MSTFQPRPTASIAPGASAGFADRDGVAQNLAGFTEADKAVLVAGMEHPQRDESLFGGLEHLEALLAEHEARGIAVGLLVLDDQDPRDVIPRLPGRRRGPPDRRAG